MQHESRSTDLGSAEKFVDAVPGLTPLLLALASSSMVKVRRRYGDHPLGSYLKDRPD